MKLTFVRVVSCLVGFPNRKKGTRTVWAAILFLVWGTMAHAQPINDSFGFTFVIEGARGQATGHNLNATAEPSEPPNQGRTVWWCWIAPATGTFSFDAAGSTFDTIVCLYEGASVSNLTQIICDDNGLGNGQSRVEFNASQEQVYWIRVDGSAGATGNIVLNWDTSTPAPTNDNFATATALNGLSGVVAGSNLGASSEPLEPENPGATVWWSWTAPINGSFAFTTENSRFDTYLCVFTGTSLETLDPVGCDDDGLGLDNWSRTQFNAAAGTTYWIRVEGFEGAEGAIELHWLPGNDPFASAVPLAGAMGTVTGSNEGASGETNEPANPARTVWWSWLAPTNGLYVFDTRGSAFDTVLCVFEGATFQNLSPLGCDDNGLANGASRVEFFARAGVTNWIRVDGMTGAVGIIQLHWQPPPPPAPTIECPVDIVVSNTAGSCAALVPFAAVGAGTPGPVVICQTNRVTVSSPALFAVGTNVITCTATNESGSVDCSFLVIVEDREGPAITCPGPLVMECSGPNGTAVGYTVSANDNCDAAATVTCLPPTGSAFVPGVTLVDCTAVDSANNTNTCSFVVAVVDTEPPVLVCTTNISLAALSNTCSAIVSFSVSASDVCAGELTVVCLPASGSSFPVGITMVHCAAADNAGNTNSCTFVVEVTDREAPAILCPADHFLSVTNPAGAIVSYVVGALDPCSSNTTVNCQPPSGSLFAPGTNTVNCLATDTPGNTNTCSFLIVVNSTVTNLPPVARCADVTVSAEDGCVAPASINADSFDPEGDTLVLQQIPAGPYPLGTNNVTLWVWDANGSSNSCSAIVTVIDSTLPILNCPGDQSLAASNLVGAVASWIINAVDACGTPAVRCEPPSGSVFFIGTNAVQCVAVDAASNTNSCTFAIVVIGPPANLAPVALCTNISVSAEADCMANASVNAGSFDPEGGTILIQQMPAGPYAVGSHDVTLVVTDPEGASNSCRATITVVDGTAPNLICPDNVSVDGTQSPFGSVVNFDVETSDTCGSAFTAQCSPPSGSIFRTGVTVVECTAADDAGNTNRCSFTVTVENGFVVSKKLGTLRGNFGGLVGMKFTVGERPLSITDLGRVFVAGNTGQHRLKVVRADNFSDLPGAFATVTPDGGSPGEFKYARLAAPVRLEANTIYLLVSEESRYGDRWYDIDSAVLPAAVGTINGGVFFGDGYPWLNAGFPNSSYGPLDFRYTFADETGPLPPVVIISHPLPGEKFTNTSQVLIRAAATATVTNVQFFADNVLIGESTSAPFDLTWTGPAPGTYLLSARATDRSGLVTTSAVVSIMITTHAPGTDRAFVLGQSLGSLRNNFSGFIGLVFTVGPEPITVSALGRIVAPGNLGAHRVKIVRTSDKTDVLNASASVSTGGGEVGTFQYATLLVPVVLEPHTTYYLVSEESAGGDYWYDRDTIITVGSVATSEAVVYSNNGITWTVADGPNRSYVPVNFRYHVGAVTLREPEGGAGEAASPAHALMVDPLSNSQVVLTLVGEPGRTYLIEASTDLTLWTPIQRVVCGDEPSQLIANGARGFRRLHYRARLVE